MTSEPQIQSIEETLTFLEAQLRAQRETGEALGHELIQLRRQVQSLAEQGEETGRAVNQIEPALAPYRGLPEKVAELSNGVEQLRVSLVSTSDTLATAERTRDAEALTSSRELHEVSRSIEQMGERLDLLTSEGAGRATLLQQLTQALGALTEWQREAREQSAQSEMRLQRLTEVSAEVEGRVRASVDSQQERALEAVHERLQILGEMAHRTEARIEELRVERHVGEEVREELGRRRDEYERIEVRVNRVEGEVEAIPRQIDEVRSATTLLDGRHSGLSERVSLIRRDIAEVVDHVREEFARFSELQEKSRRKQIETIEQELRELKFHGLRPPEKP